eukprot:781285_1
MEAGPRKEFDLNVKKYRSVTTGAIEVATQQKPHETERASHQTNTNDRKEIEASLRKEFESFQMTMRSTTGLSSYLRKSEESRVGIIHDSIDSLQQSHLPKEAYSKKQGFCSASNYTAKQHFYGGHKSDLGLSKKDSTPHDTAPPLALPHS